MSVSLSDPSTDLAPRARGSVRTRAPRPADGVAVHRLVREGGGLEPNTGYAYVLLCDHFASTTTLAVDAEDGALLGFVGAYLVPERPDTAFVWQVGVARRARGRGVASRLLDALLARDACRGVRFLEATVAPSNAASRRLFESFAERHRAPFAWSDGYAPSLFEGSHEREQLIRIGPLDRAHDSRPQEQH